MAIDILIKSPKSNYMIDIKEESIPKNTSTNMFLND